VIRRDDIGQRRGNIREGKRKESISWTHAIFIGLKIKKIHVIDLFVINGR
jgi:hypothetical protein